MPGPHADETYWDAVRARPSYRVFIWAYRLWLAQMIGLVVTVILTPSVSALWIAASGAGTAASVLILFAISLRRAGVPLLLGLTDRVLAHLIVFEDLLGETRPGGEPGRRTRR